VTDGSTTLVKKLLISLGLLLLTVLGAGLGVISVQSGFDSLRDMRQLERTPQTVPGAVLAGVVNVTGRVRATPPNLLRSPDTSTPCVYYRYHVEREERDSDGSTRWVTVSDVSRAVPFELVDETGAVRVETGTGPRFSVRVSFSRRSGNMRYTEYRLEPNHEAFVFGVAAQGVGQRFVRFDVDDDYFPLISNFGEAHERSRSASNSVLLLWLGMTLFSLAMMCLFGAFRVSGTFIYPLTAAVLWVGSLSYQGTLMLTQDIATGHARCERSILLAAADWATVLGEESPTTVEGAVALMSDPSRVSAKGADTARLMRVRLDAARSAGRVNAQLRRIPDQYFAIVQGIRPVPELHLDASDRAEVAALESSYAPTRLRGLWFGVGAVLLAIVGIIFTVLGLRRLRVARLIDSLPTTPLAGLSVGLNEVQVKLAPVDRGLNGPESKRPCVWFSYRITETRGSGKNKTTVTIHSELRHVLVTCTDDSGTPVNMNLEGVETVGPQRTVRRSGRRTHIEERIEPHVPIYALATAAVDQQTFDRLTLSRGDLNEPFLVSPLSEQEVRYRKTRAGQWLTNAGLNVLMLAALFAAGLVTYIGPPLFMGAATLAAVYAVVLIAILQYNDIVFLRQRVMRARANIDVALKKRSDVVDNVVRVVSGLMAHERAVQADLARLRAGSVATTTSDEAIRVAPVAGRVLALREAYPALRADQSVGQLHEIIRRLEDEIALMRQGFNDSVERYNTRISQFPELLFAQIGRFRPMSHLQFVEEALAPAPRIRRTMLLGAVTGSDAEGAEAPAGSAWPPAN